MADGIHILLKRANYKDTHGDISDKIKDCYLEYGEPIFLKDLNYLVIGDGEHKIPYLVETAHRYFPIAENAVFYGDASLYDVDIPVEEDPENPQSGHKIANLDYVKGYTQQELNKFLNNLIKGLPIKLNQNQTITKISYSEKTQEFSITFSDIEINLSQIKNWETIFKGFNFTGDQKSTITSIEFDPDNKSFKVTANLIRIDHTQVKDWNDAIDAISIGHAQISDWEAALKLATVKNANNIKVDSTEEDKKYYVLGAAGTGYQSVYYSSKNGPYFKADTGVLMGAAWNDFAELRQCQGTPGTVVCETGNGNLVISSERLQPGAAVISDTYGMAIGLEEEGNQPITVAGRVLTNFIGDISKYKAGDAVCAAQFGRIDKMTREEIKEYPDRILGYVSEIPTYTEWNDIKVANRIWIKIK